MAAFQHPTYKAFAELGKAIKTIFLCRYLHSEELRREINEGLNVIEQWNGANAFVFFARRGELVSNRHEDCEERSVEIAAEVIRAHRAPVIQRPRFEASRAAAPGYQVFQQNSNPTVAANRMSSFGRTSYSSE